MITVNTRTLAMPTTGVQRYAREILRCWPTESFREAKPKRPIRGMEAHAWDQLVLPFRISGNDILWSPCNSGPLAVERQVLTIHDLVFLDHPETLSRGNATLHAQMLPILCRRVRHVICPSEFTKSRIIELLGVPPEKITVIWNGVSSEFHPRSQEEVRSVRERYGLERPYLLSLGSLQPRKNLRRVERAWMRMKRWHGEVDLVLVGMANNRTTYRGPGLEGSHLRHLGHVPDGDLPALLCGSLAMVYLSIYEGFGLPIVEAMASGVPVVTSDRGAMAEIAGDATLLADPTDEEAISTALNLVIEDFDIRQSLSAAGMRRATAFSWKVNAASTLNAIRYVF